jgi:hypothetical protein
VRHVSVAVIEALADFFAFCLPRGIGGLILLALAGCAMGLAVAAVATPVQFPAERSSTGASSDGWLIRGARPCHAWQEDHRRTGAYPPPSGGVGYAEAFGPGSPPRRGSSVSFIVAPRTQIRFFASGLCTHLPRVAEHESAAPTPSHTSAARRGLLPTMPLSTLGPIGPWPRLLGSTDG